MNYCDKSIAVMRIKATTLELDKAGTRRWKDYAT